MIKVIKHGQKEFEHTCSRCGCEFTYEYEDIQSEATRGLTNYTSVSYVKCPDCGNICYVNNSNTGWPWPNSDLIPCDNLADTALNPCKDCDWHKKMTTDGINWYVGDTPCTWCQKNPMKVTCVTDTSIGSDSTTPKYQLYNASQDSNKVTCYDCSNKSKELTIKDLEDAASTNGDAFGLPTRQDPTNLL